MPGSGPMPVGIRWASHPVFASPTRVAMNLDSSRTSAEQPAPSYPDICFAADNFEEGIDQMVRLSIPLPGLRAHAACWLCREGVKACVQTRVLCYS